jgi:hypothetical protein
MRASRPARSRSSRPRAASRQRSLQMRLSMMGYVRMSEYTPHPPVGSTASAAGGPSPGLLRLAEGVRADRAGRSDHAVQPVVRLGGGGQRLHLDRCWATPARRPASTSFSLSPIIQERARSRWCLRAASSSMPGLGLRLGMGVVEGIAGVDIVQRQALRLEQARELRVNGVQVGPRHAAARHARLVGHDHRLVAALQHEAQRVHEAGQQVEIVFVQDVAPLVVGRMVDDAITVEEDAGMLGRLSWNAKIAGGR